MNNMRSLFLWVTVGGLLLNSGDLQAQADSLSAGDTMSITRHRTLFSTLRTYGYHQATGLVANQLIPVLRRSSGEQIPELIRRYKRREALSSTVTWLGLPTMTGGVLFSFRQPGAGLGLMLGGLGMTYVGPALRREDWLEQAVANHNTALRTAVSDYYQPRFDRRPLSQRLSLADTVAVRRRGLGYRFMYRGALVDPASNLPSAFELLRSGRVNSNMRYIRTFRTVSGIVSGLAAGALTGYLLSYAARRSQGPYPLNKGLVYPTGGILGLGIIIKWHLNHTQAGTMGVYNEKLREKVRDYDQPDR